MRILFVYSGNSRQFPLSPFIKDQAISIANLGHQICYYAIKGNGIAGYLSNVNRLRRYVKISKIDLIHSHYSLCGLVAIMAFTGKPVVCSYMGNDILGEYDNRGRFKLSSIYLILVSLFIQPFLSFAICKSENISRYAIFAKNCIIPNGVDTSLFKPLDIKSYHKEKKVLFLGNPRDVNKNIKLLQEALKLISCFKVRLISPYPVSHESLNIYYNEADVLVLCSIVEGSPNVVKEAMACNCPIVATDVGDVKWLLGEIEGHYVVKHDVHDLKDKIELAIKYDKRTSGRSRLIYLNLDSDTIAHRIEAVYKYSLKR